MAPLLLIAALSSLTLTPATGHLVVVGGGLFTPDIAQRTLSLAGGKAAHVLIIPQASLWSGTGPRWQTIWQQAGARQVTILNLNDRNAALEAIKTADLIWMSGGSQDRLMQALSQPGLGQAIRDRFLHGATVAGTSAGAAVMSAIMLSRKGPIPVLEDGLGLWPDVIVDQHYLRRHRGTRLLDAVLHHPEKLGVGIDEATAVLVEGRHFEVIGRSEVVVFDARKAIPGRPKQGATVTRAGLLRYNQFELRAGMTFDLDTRRLHGSDTAPAGVPAPALIKPPKQKRPSPLVPREGTAAPKETRIGLP